MAITQAWESPSSTHRGPFAYEHLVHLPALFPGLVVRLGEIWPPRSAPGS